MRRLATGSLLGLLLAVPCAAQSGAATHVVVVTGLGGAPEFAELFTSRATTLLDAATGRWGVDPSRTVWLAEDPSVAPDRIRDRSTLEALERELTALAGRAGPRDAVLILLIGHGSASGDDAKLNLPGPDLTGAALDGMLDAFTTQTIAVVNTASASGGFVPTVAGDRRIVATATRSAREGEATHFGTYFVDAFALDRSDLDKDERVSLLEAFLYAQREVVRLYESENQMLTEHAVLEDDGDGEGSLEPSATAGDGALASRFFLTAAPRAVAARAADDPEMARLLEEKTRLETAIAELRAERESLDPTTYDTRLEALLIDLARTNRAIRDRGGS